MEASDRCVYLKFGAISIEQRNAVLNRIGANLSPGTDMMLSEDSGHPCLWVDAASNEAADIAVQDRLKAVREELGLTDDQVSCTLDPKRL
jgi:hypothetical protein